MELVDAAEEIRRLQLCLNDLISILALPAMWTGREPPQVARTLLDVLAGMLRLDLVYLRFAEVGTGVPVELARVVDSWMLPEGPQAVGELIAQWLGDDREQWLRPVRCSLGAGLMSLVPLRLGLQGEMGVLVAGSGREDFPVKTEHLLLSVAANQAAIGLQEARLLSRHKQLAAELDRRVAQRTDELTAANHELRKEIAERRRAEQAVLASELNLRQLTETIPEMLWSATPDGSVDYCNTRLLDYSGFPADGVMGVGWSRLLHPDDVELTAKEWTSCVATGAPFRVEVRIFHAIDRNYRWCVTNARPLLDPEGRILKWHGTVVDMHDWKEAQESLRKTQAELAHMTRVTTMGQLTASIAHEVNQPLSGIITNASTCLRMLAADPPNVEGARETARRTIRDGNRASEVVVRLRALFSKQGTTPEAVDLNEATREVVALSSSDLQRSQVVLRSELAEDLPWVTGDRIQLQQVILNLLLNAADAMRGVDDRPRYLVIRTEREEGDRVRLEVEDSGMGIDPQSADRLFEAFYTTKENGMGIGLSVSRSIIESHQGRLWAVPNEGHGATFTFSLPPVRPTNTKV